MNVIHRDPMPYEPESYRKHKSTQADHEPMTARDGRVLLAILLGSVALSVGGLSVLAWRFS